MNNRNEGPCAVLKESTGHYIALQGVSIRGRLTETLVSIQVEQRYRNPFQHNIEAVYTFPLPMGAVLLDMEVEIADQKLSGQVIEKKVAEQQYEEAITDGNSAVMVQALDNGLYAMNVGNLLAGEPAVIRYRYALTLFWQGNQLRLTIPTTIAPRYGDAAASGLEPWQVPESGLMAEYPFDLAVSIEGKLADAEISSPTHPVGMERTECGLEVTLNRQATLDRDFVLTAKANASLENTCLLAKDKEQHVALASLRVPLVTDTTPSPLCLKIVIDCSGSMAGVSIAQARKAALVILDLLKPDDTFNITLFGGHHEHLFEQMVSAAPQVVDRARARLNCLAADFGGTEIGKALSAVYALRSTVAGGFLDRISTRHAPEKLSQPKVLMITDGEIWNTKEVIDLAAKSGHRVFTVGVGLSVAEEFVTALAQATSGACELVSPQEGMADKVLTQFHRLQQPMFGQAEVVWDVIPAWQTPIPPVLFAGDTIHVFAGFENAPPGTVQLHMPNSTVDTSAVSAIAEPIDLPDVPRLATHARIGITKDEGEQINLAVSYQLMTERTSFLVVAERQEKADNLPTLHKVPQMMAAGWGGVGVDCSAVQDTNFQMSIPALFRRRSPSRSEAYSDSGVDRCEIPAFLRWNGRDVSEKNSSITPTSTNSLSPIVFIESLNTSLAGLVDVDVLPSTFNDLQDYGLPSDIADALRAVVASAWTEECIALAFLYALSEGPLASHFERGLKRLIVSFWKRQPSDPLLYRWCSGSLSHVEPEAWNWSAYADPNSADAVGVI